MREMKDSGVEWIGMIPSTWKNKTLRHLLIDRVGGAWGNEPANENEGTVCLRIADFDFDKGLFKECALDELTYRTYTRKQIKKLALREGDILIEKSGGGEKTPVGRAVYYDDSYGAVLYANFMERLRFKSDEINSKFVEYWLRTWYFCRCSPFYINQTIGIQNIDLTLMLAKEQIFFPLLQDQYKIADFLDQKCSEIDALTADIQTQIETLEEYKKSVITEAVTKGLDPNVEMKDSGVDFIGYMPSHWKTLRIKYIGTYFNGLTYSPQDICEPSEGTLVLRSSNIKNSKLDLNDCVYVSRNINSSKMVKPEDILICSRNGSRELVGKSAYITDIKASFGAFMMILRPCALVKSKYIFYILNSGVFSYYLASFFTSTINQLTANNFGNMKIPFVGSLDEQHQIADFLDQKCSEIDQTISEKQQQLETLAEYKKSLIYEYVTGKKEVT